jgi:cytochrome c
MIFGLRSSLLDQGIPLWYLYDIRHKNVKGGSGMRTMGMIAVVAISAIMMVSVAFAMQHEATVEKGKALFNDTKLGSNGKSCNDCHKDGTGLEKAGLKDDLESTLNSCITNGLNGRALKNKSVEMQSLVLYIKSLGITKKPVVKKAPVGC